MKRLLAILVCVLLSASRSLGQTPGPAPSFQVVGRTIPDKGQIILVTYQRVMEQVPVKVLINVNGKKIEETRIQTRIVYRPTQSTVGIANGRVITPDGKQLPIDEVWKRLKENTVVVLSGDGNTPAQPYLRILNADTLIVIPGPIKEQPNQPEE